MNVAKVTVMAMNHGLMPTLGAGSAKAVAGVSVVSLMASYAHLDAKETVWSHLFDAILWGKDQSVSDR
jgi:hypothetical protein